MAAENVYFNPDAEASVISLAITYPDCVRPVCEINRNEFYYPQYQAMHEAICGMHAAKQQIDLVTMANWLTRTQKLEDAGGTKALMETSKASFLPGMLKQYIDIIHECFSRREQRKVLQAYTKKLDAGEDPEQTREWMARQIRELQTYRESELIPMKEAVNITLTQLEKDQQREGQPVNRIFSGISSMDNKLGGLSGSEYVAIGARPSVGKSIFALTYCVNAAKQGKRVLLVSLEMDEVQITERVLANQGGGTLNEITSGNISPDGWSDIGRAIGPVEKLPLWYSTTANTVEKVRKCAYEIYESGGIDMIAIDYIQLMDAEGNSRMNRQEEISKISRGLRLLAAELKIPILVLTQLNRSSVKGPTVKGQKMRQEPTMSEARESGSIEQDANIFMLLHDPNEAEMRNEEEKSVYRNLKEKGYQMMRIIIDKNRQGKRGRLTLAFDGDHMRFLPITSDSEAPY